VHYVLTIGDQELESGIAKLKDMNEGTETAVAIDPQAIINVIRQDGNKA